MDSSIFRVTPLQNMSSAFVGAVITSVTMTPLDVVKTRLQVQQGNITKFYLYCNGLSDHLCTNIPSGEAWYHRPSKFNGTLDGIWKIMKREGVLSLWSGLSPTLVLALPTTVFYFALNEEIRFILMDRSNPSMTSQPLWIPFVSASTARFLTTFISCPLELIRTKMQAERMSYLEIHRATQSILSLEGFPGLWKGASATLMRDTSFSGIYWFAYEAIRPVLDPDNKPTLSKCFIAGTTAGVISSVATTPLDVIKTRIQFKAAEEIVTNLPTKQNVEMSFMFRQIYTQTGLRGLFIGLVPRTIRIAPSCAIMISTFECGKSFFEAYNEKKLKK